jgi:hypothetical protein
MTTIPPQSGSYPSDDDLVLLSTYIDGELDPTERNRLEQRLDSEPLLRQELESLRETTALLHDLPPLTPPRSFTLDPATAPRRRSVLAFWGRGRRGVWQMSGLAAAMVLALWVTGAVLLSQGGGAQMAAAPERSSMAEQQADDAAAAPAAESDALPVPPTAPPTAPREDATSAAVAMEEAAEEEEAAEAEEEADMADADADGMAGAAPEARATATSAPTQAPDMPAAPQMTAPAAAEEAAPAEAMPDEAAAAEEEAPAAEALELPTETIEGAARLEVEPTDIAAADTLASETEDLALPEPSPVPAAPDTSADSIAWIGIAALVVVVLTLAAGAWFVVRRGIHRS